MAAFEENAEFNYECDDMFAEFQTWGFFDFECAIEDVLKPLEHCLINKGTEQEWTRILQYDDFALISKLAGAAMNVNDDAVRCLAHCANVRPSLWGDMVGSWGQDDGLNLFYALLESVVSRIDALSAEQRAVTNKRSSSTGPFHGFDERDISEFNMNMSHSEMGTKTKMEIKESLEKVRENVMVHVLLLKQLFNTESSPLLGELGRSAAMLDDHVSFLVTSSPTGDAAGANTAAAQGKQNKACVYEKNPSPLSPKC